MDPEASTAPSWFTGRERERSAGTECARRRDAAPDSPCTTRINVAGCTRTDRGRSDGHLVTHVCDATAPHRPRHATDASVRVPAVTTKRRVVPVARPGHLRGSRSLVLEVLAVTQCTPHCLRVTLAVAEVGTSQLSSGQELTLAHDGIDGMSCRWIVREFNPRTKRLTVGAVLGLGPLDARRWASSVAPGKLVWASPSNEG